MFATLTIGAAYEAARYARRSHAPVIKTETRPAARVGALELFSPDVIPTRRGLGIVDRPDRPATTRNLTARCEGVCWSANHLAHGFADPSFSESRR